jgi:hypothetical protein
MGNMYAANAFAAPAVSVIICLEDNALQMMISSVSWCLRSPFPFLGLTFLIIYAKGVGRCIFLLTLHHKALRQL